MLLSTSFAFQLLSFILVGSAWARIQLESSQNVTIDDNSSLIRYTGLYSWEPAIDLPNALDYGGYHTVSTEGDTEAQAILSFNGRCISGPDVGSLIFIFVLLRHGGVFLVPTLALGNYC
jgi:hypothetical protein